MFSQFLNSAGWEIQIHLPSTLGRFCHINNLLSWLNAFLHRPQFLHMSARHSLYRHHCRSQIDASDLDLETSWNTSLVTSNCCVRENFLYQVQMPPNCCIWRLWISKSCLCPRMPCFATCFASLFASPSVESNSHWTMDLAASIWARIAMSRDRAWSQWQALEQWTNTKYCKNSAKSI